MLSCVIADSEGQCMLSLNMFVLFSWSLGCCTCLDVCVHVFVYQVFVLYVVHLCWFGLCTFSEEAFEIIGK